MPRVGVVKGKHALVYQDTFINFGDVVALVNFTGGIMNLLEAFGEANVTRTESEKNLWVFLSFLFCFFASLRLNARAPHTPKADAA